MYKRSFTTGFQNIYGDVKDQIILALLPSYQEQGNSSLIYMVDQLIKESSEQSGYLEPNSELTIQKIHDLKDENVLLIGVSYALLDLIENYNLPRLKNWNVIETGGMKGRKRETDFVAPGLSCLQLTIAIEMLKTNHILRTLL